jgi:steroid 5-alpha reductase family enzyme
VEFLGIWLNIGLVVIGLMSGLWLVSLPLKNSSIVDIFWGAGFVIFGWLAYLLTPEGYALRKALVVLLVTIWGLRLSIHILIRNWGKPEDFRYQDWRNAAGPSWWWRSYFKVFFLQGIILWLVSAPLLEAQINPLPAHLTWLDFAAILVWLMGFLFEAVGDWQLRRFKADPDNIGKVMKTGVWRYTRHPNYFGDGVVWWALYLLALAAGGWWTVFSPILMTFLLVRVSGARLLEKSLQKDKPGYREYTATTSVFIPWKPKQR